MRIAELSRLSEVPTATIKYYLREGLLPAGERTSATQAQYDDSHLQRLRLIRALIGPGRLSIAEIRGVLAAVDDPPDSPLDLLGQASEALGIGESPGVGAEHATDEGEEPGTVPAREVIAALGWDVVEESKAFAQLAEALAAIDQASITLIPGGVERYAATLSELAAAELDTVPMDSPQTAVRQAVLGTILIEPMLIAGGGDAYRTGDDGWTLLSADGSRAAHIEHTVAVTPDGPRVLTALE